MKNTFNNISIEKGHSNVPQIKRRQHDKLSQAIGGYNYLKFKLNFSEIALLAGIKKWTLHYQKHEVEKHWSDSAPIPDQHIDFILQRSFELGLAGENNLEDLLGILLGTFLRAETDLIDNARNLKMVWKLGKHLVRVYRIAIRHKRNEDGSPVSAKNNSARSLLESSMKDNLDKLFAKPDGYKPGERFKLWKPTKLLIDYMRMSIEKLLLYITKRVSLFSLSPPSHMFPKMTVKTGNNIRNIIININTLSKLELNSIFNLLMVTTKISKKGLHIAIVHDASSNELHGRNYNVFTRIHSNERLDFGYICYDMSAAMQSISLQLIKGTELNYPVIYRYTNDDVFKKGFRLKIAQDLGIDPSEVKETLNSFPNGKVTGIGKHECYEKFSQESDRLRREVLKHTFLNDRDVLDRAVAQSKRSADLPSNIDWTDTQSKETVKDKLTRSSIFFFVWTWYERLIRQAMLTVLPDGIEVHDALYSKVDIPVENVQDAIQAITGFRIIIGKEKPKQ